MIGRNDACWCGSQKKWKKCHYPATPPDTNHHLLRDQYRRRYQILLKTPEQIKGIRRACRLTAQILEETCARAKEGVTTAELNRFAHEMHEKAGATPAPLGYGDPPYPASICTSLNEVICHGIPDDRPLQYGDIVNIDVSLGLDGYFGDASRMVVVGKASEEAQRVVDVSYESLQQSMKILQPGVMLNEIGTVISDYAEARGCSVVEQFVGHGIGLKLHEPPQIPHVRNSIRIPLAEGMTFTIEPMINAGRPEAVLDPYDGWTARTIDGKPSGQWEEQFLITADGYELLTRV